MSITELVAKTAELFKKNQWQLAVAESCTGGGLAYTLTSIPGSSQWFERGFVTYSNTAKKDMLQVEAETLEKYGAVSEETAREMAEGVLRNSSATVSIAITGIAGPDGGSPEKPVGTVWIAWAKDLATRAEVFHLKGDRDSVREQAINLALRGLIQLLSPSKF